MHWWTKPIVCAAYNPIRNGTSQINKTRERAGEGRKNDLWVLVERRKCGRTIRSSWLCSLIRAYIGYYCIRVYISKRSVHGKRMKSRPSTWPLSSPLPNISSIYRDRLEGSCSQRRPPSPFVQTCIGRQAIADRRCRRTAQLPDAYTYDNTLPTLPSTAESIVWGACPIPPYDCSVVVAKLEGRKKKKRLSPFSGPVLPRRSLVRSRITRIDKWTPGDRSFIFECQLCCCCCCCRALDWFPNHLDGIRRMKETSRWQ